MPLGGTARGVNAALEADFAVTRGFPGRADSARSATHGCGRRHDHRRGGPAGPAGLLLSHISKLDDGREPLRVLYPLREVLLLVVCATIASCDVDDIVAWGNTSPSSIMELPANDDCAPSSSSRSNPVWLLLQQRDCGALAHPPSTSSSPLKARPRAAPTISARG